MTIPVLWNRQHPGDKWAAAFPLYILNCAYRCQHIVGIENSISGDIGVIVIAGDDSESVYELINQAASRFKKVVFIIMSDEAGLFRSAKLEHPNSKIWWFAPPLHPMQKVHVPAPFGWPTGAREMIVAARTAGAVERPYDWNFMGQVTHSRRAECVKAAMFLPNGRLLETEGFSQGSTREHYYAEILKSKIVLCPAGPCMPDSFRFAEALECGCIPIADNCTQNPSYPGGYWSYVSTDHKIPFPIIDDWSTLPKVIEECLHHRVELALDCWGWWALQKMHLTMQMREDLCFQ